ncbi:M24 family metallopeptidase [bacterium]|nr:M24 family metallopeptidase [bacterium]
MSETVTKRGAFRGFERDEYTDRIRRLREALEPLGLDGALLLQRVDLIYYTGAAYQGALAVPAKGEPKLYVWRGTGRIGERTPLEPQFVRGMGKLGKALVEDGFGSWKRVGMEEDVVPVAIWKRVGMATWPEAEFKDISTAIRTQRSVKSPAELQVVRRSGKVTAAGFEALRQILKPGMPEYEVQVQFEVVTRRLGDQAAGRTRGFNAEARGVVAAGPSAAEDTAFDGPIGQPGRNLFAPMGAGNRSIRENEPIIIDVALGVDGYMTDMTRTYYCGEIDSKFHEAHRFCLYVVEELQKKMVPGAVPEELYLWAVEEAERAGFAEGFMNRGDNKVRFLGHGIGLEMDEWPVLAKRFTAPLVEGNVIALEPKVIFEDGGVGLEETFIVKEGRAEVVTPMERGLIKCG